jgi:hypothetical protein
MLKEEKTSSRHHMGCLSRVGEAVKTTNVKDSWEELASSEENAQVEG